MTTKTAKSAVLRYGLGLVPFAAILSVILLLRYYSIRVDLSLLVIVVLISATWYGGRGPGLVVGALFVVTTFLMAAPSQTSTGRLVIAYINIGAVIAILVFLVSSRRSAETRLREQREWLQVTLSSIGDAVVATNLSGAITFLNPAAESLTGWPMSEVLGKPLGEVVKTTGSEADFISGSIGGAMRGAAAAEQDPAQGGGSRRTSAITLASRDGTHRPIAYSIAPSRNQAGEATGMVLVLRDTTEQKRAEDHLILMADLLRFANDIVEQTTHAFWVRDFDGHLLRFNKAFERLMGYSGAELRDVTFTHLLPGASDEVEGEKISQLMAFGRGVRYETEYRRKDGTIVPVEVVADIYRDASGKAINLYGFVTDITERKQAEQLVLDLTSSLERRVVERTAQLEAANKELESFSYSVSHDLRAPVRHIGGFADLLRKSAPDLDTKSTRYLSMIAESATQMGRLIDDLLAFSRMGRAEMRSARVDLEHLVAEVRHDLETETVGRAIIWKVSSLPTVYGDPSMLRLVLMNLLSNAVKYTRGRGQAVIEVGSAAGTDGQTSFFVRDNGAGFDMKYADKLYGVFQRLHRADEFEGTGIGLANVRRIIHRHGGKTWADGTVGAGATFYFTLPSTGAREKSAIEAASPAAAD
jgi:PAS domain S-box-containing protein